MTIYESRLWVEDLDIVINVLPELETLAGRSVMITGAAGLICSSVVDILARYNETHNEPIHIFAAGRWLKEMQDRFGNICEKTYFDYIPYDASKDNNKINISADYIIHGAGNAFPSMIVKEPVETMLSNFTGILHLLHYAKESGTRRILYISSSEIYGRKENNEPYKEDEYGYIDILNSRNSYSVSKRAAETMCVSYADEYGVESVIVRPGHIYGPTASAFDNRISSAFAYAAARGEDIVLKSDGSQIRSYCFCLDCASALIKVLLCGKNTHAYNISNPDSIISIKRMSHILAEAGGVNLVQEEATEEDKKAFNPMSNSSLDSRSLQGIGWKGCFGAEIGLRHTVQILKELFDS